MTEKKLSTDEEGCLKAIAQQADAGGVEIVLAELKYSFIRISDAFMEARGSSSSDAHFQAIKLLKGVIETLHKDIPTEQGSKLLGTLGVAYPKLEAVMSSRLSWT